MEFMLIMYEGEPIPEGLMAEMGEFAGKLGAQGKMREGAPFNPPNRPCASVWRTAPRPSPTDPLPRPKRSSPAIS